MEKEMEDSQMFQIGKLEYTANNVPALTQVSLKSMQIDGKTLIIFGGNDTDSLTRARQYAQTANLWLQDTHNNEKIDIYSVAYTGFRPLESESGNYFVTAHDYSDFADTFFTPLFIKDGQRIDLQNAKDNMAKVAVFTHSSGAFVLDQALASTKISLLNAGYSEEEINQIFNQLVTISHAPYTFSNQPIKAEYICPFFDSLSSFSKGLDFITQEGNYHTSVQHFSPKIFTTHYLQNLSKGYGYKPYWHRYPAICIANENTIIIAPNKLRQSKYIPEDHSMAGIIQYPAGYPIVNKTPIGEATTEIIMHTLDAAFSKTRSDFEIDDIFEFAKNKYDKNFSLENNAGE